MSDLLDVLPTAGTKRRRTTPDHVADVIREAIHDGSLEDGVELNQVSLAEHFSVSRVPIREALRQLQAEGLVAQQAHHRAVVTALTPEVIDELFDVRIMLERYMLTRAVDAIGPESLDRLDRLVKDMAGLTDHDEWLRANRTFHAALYTPSEAVYTLDLAGQIAARTTRYLFLRSGGVGIKAHDQAHAEHEQIMDAVHAGDADRACHALEVHIEGTRSRVRRFLRERSHGDGS